MKSRDEATLSIGEVAERFGVATHVLRHWESLGLLEPQRVTAGRRRYGRPELFRVAAIQRAKEAGLSLPDIRAMVTGDPGDRNALLRRQRDHLAHRLAETQAALDLVEVALRCEHRDVATCPHFQGLLAERVRDASRG